MKIYTRTGDEGETGLFGGGRVAKDHPRVAAYGTVDELNAHLGYAAATSTDDTLRQRIEWIQNDLFSIGAVLATPELDDGRPVPQVPELPVERIGAMETWIDESMEAVEPLRHFILPGGSLAAAALHVARTVCRRAERKVVELNHAEPVDQTVIVYLNRLSDLLFAWARLANAQAGVEDVKWTGLG